MNILSMFTLEDVFLTAIGLVTISIMRIYYDSHMERKKIKHLCGLIDVHNHIEEDEKEGILVISNNNKVISADSGVAHIFGVPSEDIDIEYLDNIRVKLDDNSESSFMDVIKEGGHMRSAKILNSGKQLRVSLNLNRVYRPSVSDDSWSVVVIKNLNNASKLHKAADDLMSHI